MHAENDSTLLLIASCAAPSRPGQQALEDFKARIRKYEEVYDPLVNRNFHYIKLIDMVTGRGYMDVNRISGYIPGKIVFFLMQVRVACWQGPGAEGVKELAGWLAGRPAG